ncbi:MAG: DoxX family protein [Deltaproteobacteria bacterium]|nr:MAG: DoxX family protein [Deltaproteobacteria bacterium]
MTRDTLGDVGNLVLRLVTGGLMLFHGADKLMHGLDHVRSDLAAAGLPTALAHGVYVGEILAPICIIFGLWTRVSAVVYAGSIALAVAIVHGRDFARLAPTGAWAAELWVFYILCPVVIALLGGGRFSLDRLLLPRVSAVERDG